MYRRRTTTVFGTVYILQNTTGTPPNSVFVDIVGHPPPRIITMITYMYVVDKRGTRGNANSMPLKKKKKTINYCPIKYNNFLFENILFNNNVKIAFKIKIIILS